MLNKEKDKFWKPCLPALGRVGLACFLLQVVLAAPPERPRITEEGYVQFSKTLGSITVAKGKDIPITLSISTQAKASPSQLIPGHDLSLVEANVMPTSETLYLKKRNAKSIYKSTSGWAIAKKGNLLILRKDKQRIVYQKGKILSWLIEEGEAGKEGAAGKGAKSLHWRYKDGALKSIHGANGKPIIRVQATDKQLILNTHEGKTQKIARITWDMLTLKTPKGAHTRPALTFYRDLSANKTSIKSSVKGKEITQKHLTQQGESLFSCAYDELSGNVSMLNGETIVIAKKKGMDTPEVAKEDLD